MATLGIMLIVGGAIIAWSVDAFATGFEFQAIGYVMMIGGAIALAFAGVSGVGSMSQKTTEPHVSSAEKRSAEPSRS